jgi:hypothetical protein
LWSDQARDRRSPGSTTADPTVTTPQSHLTNSSPTNCDAGVYHVPAFYAVNTGRQAVTFSADTDQFDTEVSPSAGSIPAGTSRFDLRLVGRKDADEPSVTASFNLQNNRVSLIELTVACT